MAFGKIFKQEQPTATDIMESGTTEGGIDAEKGGEATYHESAGAHHGHHISPEIEKRVVRKLDWRVVPMVMALCMLLLP
jgi:hypothetical protein